MRALLKKFAGVSCSIEHQNSIKKRRYIQFDSNVAHVRKGRHTECRIFLSRLRSLELEMDKRLFSYRINVKADFMDFLMI